MKTCTKCNLELNFINFYKDTTKLDGYKSHCKKCERNQKREKAKVTHNQVSVDYKICRTCDINKPSNDFHRSKASLDGLMFQCKLCKTQYMKDHYQLNKERIKTQARSYFKQNKSKVNASRLRYQKHKESTDLTFKLVRRLRNRLYYALKRASWKKDTHFHKYIGCTLDELKQHLSTQFQSGMSWDNYGSWEIDHIIPLSSGKTQEDLYKLCHYTNLQPLWVKDNRSKSNKII